MEEQTKQLILQAYQEGLSWSQLARRFPNIPKETIRTTVRRSEVYQKRHIHQNILIEDKIKEDPTKILDSIVFWQQELKKFEFGKNEITYPVLSDYMTIIDWGDWHVGAQDVNYAKLKEDIELVKEVPNVYGIVNGDMMNNFIEGTPKGGRFEEILNPKVAKALIRNIVEELTGKWLTIVGGDHDNWSFLMDDFKPAEYFAIHGKTAFFDWGGIINLIGESFTYRIAVRHRYYGISRKNVSNPHENLWRETNADIVMLAHTHRNMSHQEGTGGERLKIFLNSGTYKNSDNFSRKLGFDKASPLFPAVVLSKHEKKAWVFSDFHDAIDFMENL